MTNKTRSRSSLSPEGVKETLDRRFSQFRGHEQQDAHEYLQCILNTLHNDLRSGEKESIKDGDVLSPLQFWISHTTRNRSVVQDQFEGLTTSLTTCPKCSFTRRTFPRSGLYVFEYTFFTHTQVRTNRSWYWHYLFRKRKTWDLRIVWNIFWVKTRHWVNRTHGIVSVVMKTFWQHEVHRFGISQTRSCFVWNDFKETRIKVTTMMMIRNVPKRLRLRLSILFEVLTCRDFGGVIVCVLVQSLIILTRNNTTLEHRYERVEM